MRDPDQTVRPDQPRDAFTGYVDAETEPQLGELSATVENQAKTTGEN